MNQKWTRALWLLLLTASLTGCVRAQATPIATNGQGATVFGTVVRASETAGNGERRLERAARSQCGGDGYQLESQSYPPGQTAPLEFTPQPTRNNFRSDFALYGIVMCEPGAPARPTPQTTPVVALFQPYLAASPDRAPVPANLVEVLQQPEGGNLTLPPSAIRGLEYSGAGYPFDPERLELEIRPDYPTGGDPDTLLGSFELSPADPPLRAQEIAGSHGGNLAVQVSRSHRIYYAFYISSVYPSAAEAVSRLEVPEGYRPLGPPETGDISSGRQVFARTLPANQCHIAVVAYDSEGRPDSMNVEVSRGWDGNLAVRHPNNARAFWGNGRAFAIGYRCPARETQAQLNLGFSGGSGPFQVQWFSRPATAEERADLTLYNEQQQCRQCDGRGEPRLACLRQAGLNENRCTTALRSREPARVGGLSIHANE